MPEYPELRFSFAAVAIVLAISVGASCRGDVCGNEIVAEFPSPDGERRVVVFERDCGATTGFSTQASLLPVDEALPNDGGNVFAADTGHGSAPSGPGGGPELRVEWESADQVLVSHHLKARIFKAEERFSGVTFRYRTFEQ